MQLQKRMTPMGGSSGEFAGGIDLLRRAREEGGGRALRVSGAGLRRRLRAAAPGGTVAGSPPASAGFSGRTRRRSRPLRGRRRVVPGAVPGRRAAQHRGPSRPPPRAGRPDPRAAAGPGDGRAGPVDRPRPRVQRPAGPAGPSPGRWSGGWATTGSSARSAGAGWGSSTRPSRSAWAAGWR